MRHCIARPTVASSRPSSLPQVEPSREGQNGARNADASSMRRPQPPTAHAASKTQHDTKTSDIYIYVRPTPSTQQASVPGVSVKTQSVVSSNSTAAADSTYAPRQDHHRHDRRSSRCGLARIQPSIDRYASARGCHPLRLALLSQRSQLGEVLGNAPFPPPHAARLDLPELAARQASRTPIGEVVGRV